jgi:hypothetical protein
VAWQLQAVGDGAKMWRRWFAELNGVSSLQHGDDWTGLMDPATCRPRWRIPRERLNRVGGRRWTTADKTCVVYDGDAGIFAGLDIGDGTVLWNTRPIPETAVSYGPAGHHVVRLLYRSPPLLDDRWLCECQPSTPSDDEPNECRSCGRPLSPWMPVEVRDRTSGRRLWTHRWPWTEPGDMVSNGALAVRGEAVLTWEGGFLRARHIADGSRLWSVPHVSVRGRPTGPFGTQSHSFLDCGMDSPRQWAWLQFVEFFDDFEEINDMFVHAATGRVVTLVDAFHHTEDDLVLALTGNTLTCLALPGAVPPAPMP